MYLAKLSDFREKIREEKSLCTYSVLEEDYGVNRWYLWNIINDDSYEPPEHIQTVLRIQIYKPAPVCDVHGIVHCYDCEKETVKPVKTNGKSKAREPSTIYIGKYTEDEKAAIRALTPAERKRRMLGG